MTDTKDLQGRIKELIVECLQLEGLDPKDIADDQPIFGEGLGLDSVDALELVLGLEQEFGIQIESEAMSREAFSSVNALADFVQGRLPAA